MPSPNPLKVRDYQLEQIVDLGGTSRQAVDEALGQGAGPSTPSISPVNATVSANPRLLVGSRKRHSSSKKKSRRDRRDDTPTGEPSGRAVSFSNSPRLQPTAPMFAEQLRASPSIRATMMRSPPSSSSYLRPIDQQQQGRDPVLVPATNSVFQDTKPSNLLPGRNAGGWYDMESSEIFRGATERPEMRDGFPPVFAEGGESALDSDSGSSSSSSSSSSGSSRKKRRRRFLRRASTVSGTSGGSTSSRSSRSSGSSGSSSSSSGIELGRRMTRAMDFALGRRRSYSSSTSSSDSDSSSSSSGDDTETGTKSSASKRRRRSSRSRSKKHKKRSNNGGASNRRRRSSRSKTGSNAGRRRARSRTFSFATRSSSPDRSVTVGGTRRKIVPTRREFSLMLPGPIGEDEDLGTGLSKSVAFAALPDRPGNKRSTTLSTIVGSPMLDPNEPIPPPVTGTEGILGQPLIPAADWRSRLMTTPSLPQVLERIKKEREKSGYEEAFLQEREVKEKEKERRRERERRRRRGHRDHGDYAARARSKARHAAEATVIRDEEPELETPSVEIPMEFNDTPDTSNTHTGGLAAIRNPMARASSWTHSLLGHATERRSGNGRKRRAIIDLSIDDTPPVTPQPSPPASAGLVPPPGLTEQRRSRPGKSRSRLLQMRSDYGVDDTSSELNTAKRSSSLVDMPGLNKSTAGHIDEGSNTSSTSSEATKADIVRPKSASDLLGMHRDSVSRSHSSTHLHSHHHRKPPEFVLPPVPRPALLRGQTGIPVAHQPPLPLRATEPTETDVTIERKLGKDGCWWLDVSCPSWEDLRDLGELLHLHPLTLEDVLQQDPREKLDVFENLGYYLIVFRAIDETYFKYTAPEVGTATLSPSGLLPTAKRSTKSERSGKSGRKKGKLEIVEDNPGKEGLEGVGVGGINIYLVVFADGIVSFHYGDISKHIDRVREKISTVEKESTNAEWIAHGLMDSIVDTFFPLIGHIDHEVDEIDSLVIDPATKPRKAAKPQQGLAVADFKATLNELNGIELSDRSSPPRSDEKDEKAWYEKREKAKSRSPFAGLGKRFKAFHKDRMDVMRLRYRLWRRRTAAGAMMRIPGQAMQRLGVFLGLNLFRRKNPNRDAAFRPVFDRSLMLRRITEMRRLTTGLTRLLGSKYQVVTRLKKRAAEQNGEVGAYIGDVQDHILTLQTSLNHYEYILSHCQPAYMSYLNVTSTIVRGDISNLILALSSVTVGYMPMVLVTSMFSMNVHIPTNLGPEDGPYGDARREDGARRPLNLWFIVLSVVFVVFIGMLLLIRYWRWQARQASRKRRTLQVKPKAMPSPTTGTNTISWCNLKWQTVKFECRRLVKRETAV